MDGYKKLLVRVKEKKGLVFALKLLDRISVAVTALVYLSLFVAMPPLENLYVTLRLVLIPGIPFVLISLLRALIDAKRPYEVYEIYDIPPKNRHGCSFPSRHAFSAFSIGTLAFGFFPILGAIGILFGAALAVSRVLLGKHFPRDVIAGAIIGTVTSVLGLIIMNI